jgi:Tat protein translocase TatC
MPNATGEMPFLDHLEELRKRILLAMAGVIVALGAGWLITRHFRLIKVISEPIAPYIPGGKLVASTLIAPFMLNLKFAMVLGLVLSSPWVLFQLWLFLSPALTPREKKAILPALGIGLVLFLAGAMIGWIYVLPPTIKWFLGFDAGTFNNLITYESYVSLVINLLVAMGISAELPLIMILLASLGILSYRRYVKFRRFALFLAFVGGAILSPAPEVVSMILFTIPLLLLYEIGVAGAWLVERRRARAARIAAGLILLALCLTPHGLHAQVPPPPPVQGPPVAGDTLRRVAGQNVRTVDSSAMKRLGLPSAPKPIFTTPDSIMQALLDRRGFAATRYAGDSVRFVVTGEQILLGGHAATLRDGGQLEADQISYDGERCLMEADGEPRMFQGGRQPLVGKTMTFNTCADSSRGVIGQAFTALPEGGANWFMRGNLAIDSSGKRLFGAHTEFTSCDLPDPHYHFVAGKVKWVSQSIIVARPAVLYIRDVPVFWLPFIFQDTKRDRSSGILIPRFGFNDIVRTNKNYNRQVTNVGYYWAPNNYLDATASVDWYSNRYTQYSGTLNYKWLDRFVTGSLTLQKQLQSGGGSSNVLQWNHDQRFDVTTSIHFNLNYQSNSTIQLNNAIDPLASTRQITSNLNLTKTYAWGLVALGGTRSQALGGGAGTMAFPSLTISPKAFGIGRHITVTPNFSVSNSTSFDVPLQLPPTYLTGGIDSLATSSLSSARSTSITLSLPTEIFGFSWTNSFQYQDQLFTGRQAVTERVAVTPGSTDSITRTTIRNGNFSTGLFWDTGINLPLIFRSTWKVTPSVGITNATGGPYLLRSASSDGEWVAQGKKLQLGLTAAPTFFAFTKGGAGPFQLFRYTLAPTISMRWSPASSVSQAYARALGSIGGSGLAEVPSTALASISFQQVFEGKLKKSPSDTNTDPIHLQSLPKKQLLRFSTSPISYDFDQAKLPGRSGWTMGVLTNSFQSDLIPALTVSTTHDLFQGDFSSDTAHFSPFLSNANASLSLTGRTFRPIARLLGLVKKDSLTPAAPGVAPTSTSPLALAPGASQFRPGSGVPAGLPRTGFTASLQFSYSRQRPTGVTGPPVSTEPTGTIGIPLDPFGPGTLAPIIAPPATSQLGISTSFSPTQFWTVSWTTQYDISAGQFESHQLHLQRDLHDWRASFDFTKGPNGNFSLAFSVFLIALPEIKFPYNQTTLLQTPTRP